MNKTRLITLLPVVIFVGLAALLFKGLSGDPSTLPSTLINRSVPEFSLPAIPGLNTPGLRAQDLRQGKVTVVNIWASWCGPCRAEHPVLMELSKRNDVILVGINNKDDVANAARFLGALGQPFAAIGADTSGRTTIDWGGYGVPETFIVDGMGIIRYKHVGPLGPDALTGRFAEEIKKAAQALPSNQPTGEQP
jgi:cytochrome c biogenesis protein CcmG, thiol:disulfide interchange protein DsbE